MPRCPARRPWWCPLTLVFISFSIPQWTPITIILLPVTRQTDNASDARGEKGRDLCLAFIDHTKVFDSVNREALWACLARLGCPPKCVNITRQLHEGMKGCVLYAGEQSGSYNINTGVKQCCGLAPALFSIKKKSGGIYITSSSRTSQGCRHHLSHRRGASCSACAALKPIQKWKQHTSYICNKLMTVLLLPTRRPTYRTPLMLFLKNVIKLLGVNVTKTKVIFQPTQPLTATAQNIDIEGTTLENLDRFAYLGGYVSKSSNIDVEIQHRIRCACFSYCRLKDRTFSERGFRTATEILVYKAVILTTLLYMAGGHGSPTVATLKCSNSSNSTYSELSSVSTGKIG